MRIFLQNPKKIDNGCLAVIELGYPSGPVRTDAAVSCADRSILFKVQNMCFSFKTVEYFLLRCCSSNPNWYSMRKCRFMFIPAFYQRNSTCFFLFDGLHSSRKTVLPVPAHFPHFMFTPTLYSIDTEIATFSSISLVSIPVGKRRFMCQQIFHTSYSIDTEVATFFFQ